VYLQGSKAYFAVWIPEDWPSLRHVLGGFSERLMSSLPWLAARAARAQAKSAPAPARPAAS
jgi:hypothetical protein